MKCAHTTTYRGKRVLVRMRDGTKFVDRFKDCTRSQVVFEGRRVMRDDMKSMSIYREPAVKWTAPHGYTINSQMAKEIPNNCPCEPGAGRAKLNQRMAGGSGNDLCGQPLDDGTCSVHGKVKFGLHDKDEDEDEKEKKYPALHKYSSRRSESGKIIPKRFFRVRMKT